MHDGPHTAATLCEAYAGAARVVDAVQRGTSLNEALVREGTSATAGPSRAAIRDLSYATLRDYGRVHRLLEALVHRAPSDPLLQSLLYVTVADLRDRRAKAFVAVDQAVRAARLLDLHPATGLVNAVLRNYLRRADDCEDRAASTPTGKWRHPQWWIDAVQAAHPQHWQSILDAGNAHPPLTLRVNARRTSVAAVRQALDAAAIEHRFLGGMAIMLAKALPVARIPGFDAGLVSVQDLGAQHAAPCLDVRPGQRVLDACAAPGGKTCHILESTECELLAVDHDRRRCERIEQNLQRLGLSADVRVGDATRPEDWWDGKPFDRVLLDAPCSASGIVRRHPDIKWHRRAADLPQYARVQSALLEALWRVLVPGGKLLYATCSIFPEENEARIDAFVREHPETVRLLPPGLESGQLLPTDTHDGFFYALLEKR